MAGEGRGGRERERGGEGRKGKGEGGAPSARRAQGPQNTLRRLCLCANFSLPRSKVVKKNPLKTFLDPDPENPKIFPARPPN